MPTPSLAKRVLMNSKKISYRHEVHLSEWRVDVSSARRVSALLFVCAPSAITRFIVSVIVDSIKAMGFARPRAHILIEGRKAVEPSVANNNAARAIGFVARVFGVVAPKLHLAPCGVLSTSAKAMGLATKASAAFSVSAPERACKHKSLFPAFAFAMPANLAAFLGAATNNCQLVKNSASQIMPIHGDHYAIFR